ncbi:MAG: hypothetical protein NT051_05020 [Candidatus Micrarchaeota archaeon]|nr:hypothetical protein [Candidatus Micrarchaeota archaeon]
MDYQPFKNQRPFKDVLVKPPRSNPEIAMHIQKYAAKFELQRDKCKADIMARALATGISNEICRLLVCDFFPRPV